MAAEYHFVTSWKIPGTAHEVAEVLGDPLPLARWWPSVYWRCGSSNLASRSLTSAGSSSSIPKAGCRQPPRTGIANLIAT